MWNWRESRLTHSDSCPTNGVHLSIPALLLGQLMGSVLLSLFGTMGASIVLGARRSGVLLPLLGLVAHVLIFGAAAAGGFSPHPHLMLLAAMLAAALPLCPLAAGAGLQAAVE